MPDDITDRSTTTLNKGKPTKQMINLHRRLFLILQPHQALFRSNKCCRTNAMRSVYMLYCVR